MIIKRMIEQEVKVCDNCKTVWERNTQLSYCFICGSDLCFTCAEKFGNIHFCKEHYKLVWEFIKENKLKFEELNKEVEER